jgi:alkylation response protein AidB-like acyl-CoA dehydrogenase
MNFDFTEREEGFRKEVRAWLERNLPDDLRGKAFAASRADVGEVRRLRAWQKTMAEAGYVGMDWPVEFGGRGAAITEMVILYQEMARAESPQIVNRGGVSMLGPTLMKLGTPEQQRRFLPRIRTAEDLWCQGFSEPNAGSDLANLQTRAVLDGDHFVVNGQKVWTSGAHHSDWCLCYVRTDPDVPKHKGISVLLIDMRSPGVEARPFAELSEPDYFDFNEVFFTDVIVPRENLLGELNQGWALTQGSLSHERAMLWVDHAYAAQRAFTALTKLADRIGADGNPLRDDARFRDRVGDFYVDVQATMLMGYRGLSKAERGKPAPEHSLLKLHGSETVQKLLLAATEMQGHEALDVSVFGPKMWRDGAWAIQYLRSFAGTIPGGTSEIQRNIIAERVLGLPRS